MAPFYNVQYVLNSGSIVKMSRGAKGAFTIRMSNLALTDLLLPLGRIPRWNGNTLTWWSVLHHTLLCYKVAMFDRFPDDILLHILLHDAHEAVIGDIVRPIARLFPELDELKTAIDAEIYKLYGIHTPYPSDTAMIKTVDNQILATEAYLLMHENAREFFPDGYHAKHGPVLQEILKEYPESFEANSPLVVEVQRLILKLLPHHRG